MSSLDGPHVFGSGSADDADTADSNPTGLAQLLTQTFVPSFERTAFWTAVVLPFLYVPLLFGGIHTSGELVAFAVLLAINLLALYLGHDHEPR